jgi:S1-C subfamily serine protease
VARRLVSLVLCAAAAAVGACGGSDSTSSVSAPTTTTTTSTSSISSTGVEDSAPVAIEALGATVTASTAGEHGLVVQSVAEETKTRLQVGDVIVSLNGAPVGSPEDMVKELATPNVGDSFTIEVVRGDKRFTLSEVASPTAYLGAEIKDGEGGVAVVSVSAGGPAEKAGIKAGDLIVAIDRSSTPDSQSLLQTLATHAPGETVTVTVKRGSDALDLDVTLVEHP